MRAPWPTVHNASLHTSGSVPHDRGPCGHGCKQPCPNFTGMLPPEPPWPSVGPTFGRMGLGKSSLMALEEGLGSFQQRIPGPRYPQPDLEGPPCPWLPLAPCSHSVGRGPATGRPEQMVLKAEAIGQAP